uniref:Cathepsin K n=1 Tax=Anabas testudineus TaxID=64144 RepID=A0A7N6A0F4_ANATE
MFPFLCCRCFRMLLCVCVMLLVAAELSFCLDEVSLDAKWKEWKISYGKKYEDVEEVYWRTIWEQNMRIIEIHNQEAEQGKHSYKLGMNHRGDMGTPDTEARRLSYFRGLLEKNNKSDSLPKSVDYREDGIVTGVRSQGNCGSCWAFSAAGALEGQLARKTGQLLELSPQNLVDCVLDKGCDGGYMGLAYKYVTDNGGLNSEEDYPYVGKQKCRFKPSAVAAQCKGFKMIPKGDEDALAEALNDVGPLSVVLNVGDKTHCLLVSCAGIYYNPECDENQQSHAMLLVGYGETAKGEKYWIVKNSWGEHWGEKGYIRIARDCDNHCGIASQASYPLM